MEMMEIRLLASKILFAMKNGLVIGLLVLIMVCV